MNKYLIAYSGINPRTALANKDEVIISNPSGTKTSLSKKDDNWLYTYTNFKGEECSVVLTDNYILDLPELIAIMSIENPDMFEPTTIAKVNEMVTLFSNK